MLTAWDQECLRQGFRVAQEPNRDKEGDQEEDGLDVYERWDRQERRRILSSSCYEIEEEDGVYEGDEEGAYEEDGEYEGCEEEPREYGEYEGGVEETQEDEQELPADSQAADDGEGITGWTREAWEFSSSKIYTEDSGAGSYFGEDGAGEGYFAHYYQEFSEGELRAPEEEEKEGEEEAGRGSAEEEEGPDEEEEEEEDEEDQGWLYEEVDEKYDYRRMEEGEDEEWYQEDVDEILVYKVLGISRPTTPEVVEITNTDPVEDPIEAPIETTKNNNTRRTTSPSPPADSLHPPTTTKRRISESPSPSFGDLPSSPPTKRLKLETTPDEATFSGACTQSENQS